MEIKTIFDIGDEVLYQGGIYKIQNIIIKKLSENIEVIYYLGGCSEVSENNLINGIDSIQEKIEMLELCSKRGQDNLKLAINNLLTYKEKLSEKLKLRGETCKQE